jgi:hypothetical protein
MRVLVMVIDVMNDVHVICSADVPNILNDKQLNGWNSLKLFWPRTLMGLFILQLIKLHLALLS